MQKPAEPERTTDSGMDALMDECSPTNQTAGSVDPPRCPRVLRGHGNGRQ